MSHNDNNQQQQPVGVPPPQGDLKKAFPKPKRPGKTAPPRPRKAPVRCTSKAAPPCPRKAPVRCPSKAAVPPSSGFLKSCLAALCCCCLLDACL